MLEQVADDPGVRLSGLELLGEAERRQVLEAWSRTAAEPSGQPCVAPALRGAGGADAGGAGGALRRTRALTYRALNERANRLAHAPRPPGRRPRRAGGDLPGARPELMVSVLAVLKAGGAYVPLDPGYPAERLAFMVADAAAPVLLTQASLRGALPALEGVRVLSVDGGRPNPPAPAADEPRRPGHAARTWRTSSTPPGPPVRPRG